MKIGAQKEPRKSQIGIFEKGWPFKKATLYVYVEGDSLLEEEALAEATQEANRQWQQSRLSTTAALQEAAAAGIRTLLRRGGARSTGVGVSCAILQDEGVYLALGGATRAYILAPQVCRRIASSSPWDPNHIDVREEPLTPDGMVLLAPSVLEGALPLLQGGLPPREAQRLFRAWLQDKPQLSALLLAHEGTRDLALGMSAEDPDEEEQPTLQPSAKERPSAIRGSKTQPTKGPGSSPPLAEAPFHLLRALRLPLLIVAVLLALLILGGVGWYLPTRQKGQDEVRLTALLERATQARQDALRNSDPSSARSFLVQAESLVQEAASIRAKDKRVVSLRQEIDTDLDRVNSVIRPASVTLLADLAKQGGDQSSPSRVVVDGNNLYVLDKGAGRLYKFLLDQRGPSIMNLPNNILVRKGDLHGGSPLTELWDVLWMPPGPLRPGASLLMLGSQGILVDYRPDKGLQVLPLRGFLGWTSFKGARGYNGNLYVLDPPSGQVWRYVPTSTGYDSEARGILEGANIGDGVDLAVDGNVYVLTAKGTVWKFAGDVPQAFRQDKLDKPLFSPVALFAASSTQYVYVVDRGNGRIVAFSKEGDFRFQIRAEAL
ncbi:MAG: hypothetical protein Q8P59_03505, partial [Dehalococcoidia bacterium]|nr:hypothetical protein [Dehalococcoidia bacterium]